MTPFLKSIQKSSMGLYDSQTLKDVNSFKVIDATDLCPKTEQIIIKYGKAKRGLIAQVVDLYAKEKDSGMCVHYFLGETSAYLLSEDSALLRFAVANGADPRDLAYRIFFPDGKRIV